MRNRIWTEVTQTRFEVEFLKNYLIFQDSISKYVNICILLCSSGGILSWSVFKKPEYSAMMCIITTFISLIKLISPHFIHSEKETRRIEKYYSSLKEYYNKLETFWYKYNETNNDKVIIDNFHLLITNKNDIECRYLDISVIHISFIIKKAKKYTDIYFDNAFNTKN